MRRFLCLMLFVLSVFACANTAEAIEFLRSPSQQEIVTYANSLGINSSTSWVPHFDGSGNPEQNTLNQAKNLLNLYRYIVGTSPVGFSNTYSYHCQNASLAMAKLDTMAHYLPYRPTGLTDAQWQSAQTGCASSNLGKGYVSFWRMEKGMVADHTGTNISIQGHRRWMLSPNLGTSGAGMVGSYSALWVVDSKYDFNTLEDKAVAWPATNTPTDLFEKNSPWSLSLPSDSNINQISVSVTRASDNKTWLFSRSSKNLWVDNQDLGDGGAIIWLPEGLKVSSGDTFNVSVRGTSRGDFDYTVSFFDAHIMPANDGRVTDDSSWYPAPGKIVGVVHTGPVHRLYNKWSGEHHFTADEGEYANLCSIGWTDEGIAWVSAESGPYVYKLYNPYTYEHFYTTSDKERARLCALGWTDEGAAFYSCEYTNHFVYRLWNGGTGVGSHHYTVDKNEYESLQAIGWRGEGIAWRAI